MKYTPGKEMTREEEFELVFAIFNKWGWHVAFEDLDEEGCRGLVAGEVEYLDDLLLLKEPQDHWRTDVHAENAESRRNAPH